MNVSHLTTLVLASLSILASCAHCDSGANGDWDVGERADAEDAARPDADALDPDISNGDARDSDVADDTADIDSGVVDRSWDAPKRCEGTVNYPPSTQDFPPPDRPDNAWPSSMTRDWLEDTNRIPPEGAYRTLIAPSYNLEPHTSSIPYDLYASPGEDVTFQFVLAQTAPSLEGRKIFLSMLVDYKPVEFDYKRWSPNRERVIDSGTTTGLRWDVQQDVAIVDVTIPASSFDDGARMYELQTYAVFNERPEGVGFASYDRYALYYGDYNRPEHPCFEPALQDEMNELETSIVEELKGQIFSARKTVGLIPARAETEQEASDLVFPNLMDVSPGEQVTFNVTFPSQDHAPARTVGVPLLDGKPLDIRWFFMTGEPANATRRPPVSTRKQFTVTAPEEEGQYYLQVASWRDSYLSTYAEDGSHVEGVVNTYGWTGSNFVILDVAE